MGSISKGFSLIFIIILAVSYLIVTFATVHFGAAQSNTSNPTHAATVASVRNNSLELNMSVDKTLLSLGETVNLTLTITNISSQTINFTHTGLDFDFQVYNGTNNLVYQYSNFIAISATAYIVALPAGEGFSDSFTWQQTCNFNAQVNGDPVSPGTYNLIGETNPTYGLVTTPIQLTIAGAPTSTPTSSPTPISSAYQTPSLSPNPTPSIPEFPMVVVAIPFFLSVLIFAVILRHRKTKNLTHRDFG